MPVEKAKVLVGTSKVPEYICKEVRKGPDIYDVVKPMYVRE